MKRRTKKCRKILTPYKVIPGCSNCIKNCPVQAIKDFSVNQKLCRTNTYSVTERGFDTVECNKCRSVCPRKNGIRSN